MRLTHRLDHNWQTNPPHPRQLDTWASTHPVLRKPLDQIRSDIISWDTPTSDAVVRPLLELAAAGDHDAARLLLVALAGALAKTAFRCPSQPAQDAFDDLVSQLAEVILTPHPFWTRALADQAVRMTTRRWLKRTESPVKLVPLAETIGDSRSNTVDELVESLTGDAIINSLAQRYRLSKHTVSSLRVTAFGGETPGATERPNGGRAHGRQKERQRAFERIRSDSYALSVIRRA
jgi:hypothetical protein